MKRSYLSIIILLASFIVKAQHNVILEALDAPDPAFTITACNIATTGWLGKGLPAGSADIAASQEIAVNVTAPGAYAFTTGAVNGVTFSASGTFATTGVQNVTLIGSGTPVNYTVDNNSFSYTVTNTTGTNAGSCGFTRKVYQPDQNYTGTIRNDGKHRFLYKVITGPGSKEWLQTNLGAHYNQVGHASFDPEMAATNVNDYLAFGSLFQGGRNSDGHELLNWTSATTANGLSTTATPAPAPNVTANTGLFYTSTSSTAQTGNYYGSLTVLNGRNAVGPGMPCPTGFAVAMEYADYPTANYNAGSTPWLNNAIKLVAPQLYRNAANGILATYARRLMRTNSPTSSPASLTASTPQFVIEGGLLNIGAFHYDRRVVATYDGTIGSDDVRGSLDGYPVRCVKP